MKVRLTPLDFTACPVWKFDPETEAYLEVRGLADIPGDLGDLQILAEFVAASGLPLRGAITGVTDVFAIRLFAGDEAIGINKHAHQDAREQVAKFLAVSGLSERLSFETLFPLRFKTRWSDGGVFNDFEGVFDMRV